MTLQESVVLANAVRNTNGDSHCSPRLNVAEREPLQWRALPLWSTNTVRTILQSEAPLIIFPTQSYSLTTRWVYSLVCRTPLLMEGT